MSQQPADSATGKAITSTSTREYHCKAWVAYLRILELLLFILVEGDLVPEVRSFGEREFVGHHLPVDCGIELLHNSIPCFSKKYGSKLLNGVIMVRMHNTSRHVGAPISFKLQQTSPGRGERKVIHTINQKSSQQLLHKSPSVLYLCYGIRELGMAFLVAWSCLFRIPNQSMRSNDAALK